MFAAIVALIGAALGAASQMQSAKEQKDFREYQAQQDEADAQAAKAYAELNATAIRKRGRQQAKAADAALAASGVSLGSPGAVNINQDIYATAEEEAQNAVTAGGYQAAKYGASAQASRIAGNQAMNAGYLNATSSLMSGYSSASQGWKKA